MPPDLLFDYFGVRLNGEKAAGKKIVLNIAFTDLKESYTLTVENGALTAKQSLATSADATVTLAKTTLDNIELGQTTLKDSIAAGDVKIEGKEEALSDFLGLLDNFPFWFNIVTP
jgi:alkyl sulfatase BDS1-like metallo-beta-lactamase superfamily hydrolase